MMGNRFHRLLSRLPTPIAFVLDEFLRAPDAFRALWRMVDAAEIITRFFAITVLSDLLRQRGEFPEPVRNVLTENLEHPTFGAWRELLAVAVDNLPRGKEGARCFVAELPSFVRDRWLPALGGGEDPPEEKLIALRNLLAHAGRLPDVQARKLHEAHRERFEALIRGMAFLTEYALVACDREACDREEGILRLKGLPDPGQAFPKFKGHLSFAPQPERVYLVRGGEGLDLFPLHAFTDILQWRGEGFESLEEAALQIYFRVSRKGYLEYISFSDRAAFSHLGEEAYQRFQEIFRLEEWRARQRQEEEARGVQRQWEELVRELTEVLVGREEHIRQVKEAIKGTGKGFLWISGKPGIGKSALMAKLMKDYVGQTQRYIVVPYFFRLGQPGCSTMEFLSAALKRLQAELHRTIEPAPRLPDRQRQWAEALEEAARTGKKVLFLVDGLDEIYRQEREFMELPFMALREGIVWVCAGRSERELEEALQRRGARWVFPEGLPPLGADAIRTMLTEHLGRLKYELFERDEGDRNRFVEAVARKSEGLPLYVRMLVEDLKARQWTVRDEGKLPQGLAAYYERLLERLRASDAGTVLTPLFCLLAWAKDPIPEGALKFLLRVHHLAGSARWDEWFRRALESGHLMLQRRSTPDGEAGWTIYHDSFRQHLLESEAVSGNREWAQRRWVDVGEDREALASQEPSLHRYILRHYAEHLYEAGEGSALFRLALDPAFAKDQARHLPDEPHLPLKAVQLALEMAIRSEDAPRMARLLIEHARRAGGEETPLQAWRRGHRERALRMATEILFERDYWLGTLWSLLLAWVAASEGEGEWARRILEAARKRWEGGKLAELYLDWQTSMVMFWLSKLEPVEGLVEVAYIFLNDDEKRRLIEGWVSKGWFDYALQLAQGIEIASERAEVLGMIAKAMGKVGMAEQAKEVFERAFQIAAAIEEAGKRAFAFGLIAAGMAQVGMIERAREVFDQALQVVEEIEEAQGRARALAMIAKEMARTTMVEQAMSLFDHALQIADGIQERWNRAKVFRMIAEMMIEAGLVEPAKEILSQALRTVGDIGESQETEGAEVLAWIARSMVDAGMIEKAWEVFNHALRAVEKIREKKMKEKRIQETQDKPRIVVLEEDRVKVLIYIIMKDSINKAIESQLFDQAIKFAKTIEDIDDQSLALGMIGEGLAKAGMIDRSREVFEEALMILNKKEMADSICDSLAKIAKMMAKAGMLEWAMQIFGQAMQIVEGIEEVSYRDNMLRVIVEEMAEAEMFDRALEEVGRIQDLEYQIEVLVDIAERMAEAGMVEQAAEIFSRVLQAAEGIGEGWNQSEALRMIARRMAEKGMLEQALQVAQGIGEVGKRVEELQMIAEGMTESGMIERAKEILSQALQAAKEIKKAEGQAEALGEIAERMAELGMAEQAREVFNQALWAAKGIKQEWNRSEALRVIAERMARTEMFDQALQVAGKIEETWNRSEALRAIAGRMAEEGMFDQAIQVAEGIEVDTEKSKTLQVISEKMAKAEMFDQALQVAEEIVEGQNRAWALGVIAERIAEAGIVERAIEILDQALQVAEEVKEEPDRVLTLMMVAARMWKIGIEERAIQVWDRALQPSEGNEEEWKRLQMLMRFAERGMIEEAVEIFERALQFAKGIEETEVRAESLGEIAESMLKAGMVEQAKGVFDEALKVAGEIKERYLRGYALEKIMKEMAGGLAIVGEVEAAIDLVKQAVGFRAHILPSVLSTLAERATEGDEKSKRGFLRLLPLCGWSLKLAYQACGLLAGLYPEQAEGIARVVMEMKP
jgi:tetratricopeptide (TPR) repeat protein